MEKIPTLIVTNPTTGTRAAITGFKSLGQAKAFGDFRKMKGTVKNPKEKLTNYQERLKYELNFHHSQEELKQEIKNYFYL